uniref:Transposase Tc1-like domain-containing protein n=1 Tax=Stegastes partitus TaxID=144197 RepID=A0A3B5A298_9TELE
MRLLLSESLVDNQRSLQELEANVLESTIRRTLNTNGAHSGVARIKPLLSTRNKGAKLHILLPHRKHNIG